MPKTPANKVAAKLKKSPYADDVVDKFIERRAINGTTCSASLTP
jgi:pyruvate/oxaloacetate carboxyltransferase